MKTPALVSISYLLLLTACGGGGSGPAPAAAPAAVCTPVAQVVIQTFGDSTQVGQYNVGALQAELDIRFGAGATLVQNRAVSGTTSAQLIAGADGLNAAWPGSVAAHIVMVNHGINDQLYATPLASYRANEAAFAAAPAMVVLETPNPVTADWGSPAYAQAVREVAAGSGAALADVDRYVRTVPDWQTYLADGVHPNVEMHKLIARYVTAPALAPLVSALRCGK